VVPFPEWNGAPPWQLHPKLGSTALADDSPRVLRVKLMDGVELGLAVAGRVALRQFPLTAVCPLPPELVGDSLPFASVIFEAAPRPVLLLNPKRLRAWLVEAVLDPLSGKLCLSPLDAMLPCVPPPQGR